MVRGDEADVFIRFQIRVDDHHRDSGLDGAGNGFDRRLGIERGQHNAVHPAGYEVFHHLDLLVAVIFFQGAFPNHVHFQSFLLLRNTVAGSSSLA